MILDWIFSRLTSDQLHDMVMENGSFWIFIRNQPDFGLMRIQYKLFGRIININKISRHEIMVWLWREHPDLFAVLNDNRGQRWLEAQIQEIRQELGKA
ncbi:hypothetical protein HYS50_01600 [Candidatus Woesearchaeota archaeon]|nr:hypothetical protein [Candidatus Woesearchaeota archaeon]